MSTEIKARRWYQTDGRGNVPREWVRVTGWQDVRLGIAGSTKWPEHTERWCRIRHKGEKVSAILTHPSRLDASTETTENPWE